MSSSDGSTRPISSDTRWTRSIASQNGVAAAPQASPAAGEDVSASPPVEKAAVNRVPEAAARPAADVLDGADALVGQGVGSASSCRGRRRCSTRRGPRSSLSLKSLLGSFFDVEVVLPLGLDLLVPLPLLSLL